jgi:hypothetical protein
VAEAAQLLGLTVDAVRKRLQRGRLAGIKIDGEWLVMLDRPTVVQGDSPPRSTQDGTQDSAQDRVRDRTGVRSGQRHRTGQRSPGAELVEQLRSEIAYLRDQVAKQDELLLAFAQGTSRLPAPADEPSPASEPGARRFRLRLPWAWVG